MATTLKDIAEYVGTSVATVSKVLGNKEIRVSEDTRKRVLEAAEVLNYIPNVAGIKLKKGGTDTIAVIVGDLLYPYYAKLLKEIARILEARGISIVVCDIDNDHEIEKKHYMRLKTGYVDGAIVVPSPSTMSSENLDHINKILGSIHVPVAAVLGGGAKLMPDIPTVGTDPYASARLAVEYLISLGHRKIGYVSEMGDLGEVNLKYTGYKDALKDSGIEPYDAYVTSGYARYMGGRTAYEVLKDSGITAVLCSSDMLAIGYCSAAAGDGRRIPDDISVIGMDNTMMTRLNTPQITTINQDVEILASAAVDMLMTEIAERRKDGTGRAAHMDIDPEIIRRGRCSALRG